MFLKRIVRAHFGNRSFIYSGSHVSRLLRFSKPRLHVLPSSLDLFTRGVELVFPRERKITSFFNLQPPPHVSGLCEHNSFHVSN